MILLLIFFNYSQDSDKLSDKSQNYFVKLIIEHKIKLNLKLWRV